MTNSESILKYGCNPHQGSAKIYVENRILPASADVVHIEVHSLVMNS